MSIFSLKYSVLIFSFILLKMNAAFALGSQCEDYLTKSNANHSEDLSRQTQSKADLNRLLNINRQNIRPYIGVIVKIENGDLLLAIGPYFGNNHQEIVKTLLRKKNLVIEGFVWGGELLMSKTGRSLTIFEANETSGFLYDLLIGKSELRNNLNPWFVSEFQDLNYAFVLPSHVGFLDFFKDTGNISLSSNYIPKKFDPNDLHLLPGLSWSGENMRHDFGNQVATMLAHTELISRKLSFMKSDMDLIKKTLKQLHSYVQAFLLWQNSEVQSKKINHDLNRFLSIYKKFIQSNDLLENFSAEDWNDLSLEARLAFEIVFSKIERPILYEFKVSDTEQSTQN